MLSDNITTIKEKDTQNMKSVALNFWIEQAIKCFIDNVYFVVQFSSLNHKSRLKHEAKENEK